MNFRIINKNTNSDINNEKNLSQTHVNDFYHIETDLENICVGDDSKKIIFLGGEAADDCEGKFSESMDMEAILKIILLDFSMNIVHKNLQGKFVLIYINGNEIQVITDSFSRADIYYSVNNDSIEIVSDMSLLTIDKHAEGYNQNALAHLLTYYGNRPAKKQTIYNAINRLGVLEVIKLSKNNFNIEQIKFQPKVVKDFTHKDNERYSEIFLKTLKDAGSENGNVVYLSSGWDSTSILAGLVSIFGSDKVRAITGKMKYSDRSGVCNAIEIEKAQKFADYYGVKLDIVDFDYASRGPELIESALPVMKKHGFFNVTGVNHAILAKAAKKIIGDSKQVVFAGEISDGAHNFGFSQYATIFHPSYGFREYADKMASYLFGPTFLNRIIKGDYKTDPIYKCFYSDINFKVNDAKKNKKSIVANLFIDFYLRNGRRPFWSGENIDMLTTNGLEEYTNYHYEQYLSICENLNLNSLYSYYLHLYNSFHWQASTVATLPIMAEEYGMKTCLPFWDKNLQDFLSEMPENWGRGLDLHNTKYPLKWMLKNKLDYPIEIQEGPHAYTYDIEHSFNHYEEILCHSSLAEDVHKIIRNFSFESILSKEKFNYTYIENLVERYISKAQLSGMELNEIFSLYFLAKQES